MLGAGRRDHRGSATIGGDARHARRAGHQRREPAGVVHQQAVGVFLHADPSQRPPRARVVPRPQHRGPARVQRLHRDDRRRGPRSRERAGGRAARRDGAHVSRRRDGDAAAVRRPGRRRGRGVRRRRGRRPAPLRRPAQGRRQRRRTRVVRLLERRRRGLRGGRARGGPIPHRGGPVTAGRRRPPGGSGGARRAAGKGSGTRASRACSTATTTCGPTTRR